MAGSESLLIDCGAPLIGGHIIGSAPTHKSSFKSFLLALFCDHTCSPRLFCADWIMRASHGETKSPHFFFFLFFDSLFVLLSSIIRHGNNLPLPPYLKMLGYCDNCVKELAGVGIDERVSSEKQGSSFLLCSLSVATAPDRPHKYIKDEKNDQSFAVSVF